jgi:phosphoribosylformimino-5-aminoimidazole carboxamide ribonucleotide (ProFAR) isomerase
MKAPQKSLKKWTEQKWRTKSGKPSGETGERYLPENAIKSLSSAEYAATTKAKREGTAKGKQFVSQPKSIAEKTRKFRAAEGGLAMNEGMKALKKAAPEVAKKMGYKKGGMTKKGYAKGGYAKGGYAMCGASNPPAKKR